MQCNDMSCNTANAMLSSAIHPKHNILLKLNCFCLIMNAIVYKACNI